MAQKKEYREYQIKHLVRAMVYETVIAETPEDAIAKARKTMSGKIFIDKLEVVDELSEFAGYDDMTTWGLMED